MQPMKIEEIKRLLNVCYQCGTCVSTCAAGMVNQAKNIRKLVEHITHPSGDILPEENELLWFCSTCYQCEDRCPEGVPLTTLLLQLRNMAAEKGALPAAVRREIDALSDCGFTAPPLNSMLSRRRKLGLPDLPRPDRPEMDTLIDLTRPHPQPPVKEGEST
jgi:heterodisulfide reductase subunit C